MLFLIFGVLGSFYAIRALIVLRKSPEVFRLQRKFWLPILAGTVFFSVGGVLHLVEHFIYPGQEMGLLEDIFISIGVLVSVIGIIRYSQSQIEYYRIKREGLEKARVAKI